MKHQGERAVWGGIAMIGTLLAASVLGTLQLTEARQASEDAMRNLQACQTLAAQIQELRGMDTIASDSHVTESVVTASILELARAAGISEGQISGIERLPSATIPTTEYARDDAILKLTGVTMEQVVRLMLAASASEQEITPTSLSLVDSGARGAANAGPELWNAELALTHLIYAATSN